MTTRTIIDPIENGCGRDDLEEYRQLLDDVEWRRRFDSPNNSVNLAGVAEWCIDNQAPLWFGVLMLKEAEKRNWVFDFSDSHGNRSLASWSNFEMFMAYWWMMPLQLAADDWIVKAEPPKAKLQDWMLCALLFRAHYQIEQFAEEGTEVRRLVEMHCAKPTDDDPLA